METIAKFSDEEQEEVYQDDDNLWWDSNFPPSHFYSLVYDDDDLSLYGVDEYAIPEVANEYAIPKAASEYKVFNKVADEFNLMLEDVTMQKSDILDNMRVPSDNVMMPPNKSRDMLMPTKPVNVLMQSVVKFLRIATPDAIYKPNWREEFIQEWIAPELLSVWTNADKLFDDKHEEDDDIKFPPPDIRYPTIDFTQCNIRSIANVPKPGHFPVLGCSPDPIFYTNGGFKYSYPFGGKYGYKTNLGIVPVPDEPVYGYVWYGTDYDSDWVLCAVQPPDQRSKVSRKWQGFRRKG